MNCISLLGMLLESLTLGLKSFYQVDGEEPAIASPNNSHRNSVLFSLNIPMMHSTHACTLLYRGFTQ